MTTTIRKSAIVETYIQTVDRIRSLSAELKQLEAVEKNARPQVLTKISANGSQVKIDGVVRLIRPDLKLSHRPAVDAPELIAWADSSGLPVAERESRWIPPATFGAWARKGLVPADMITETSEVVIIID